MSQVVQLAATRVGAAMATITLAVALAPQALIRLVAPGLSSATSAESALMLRIMAPSILLAGAQTGRKLPAVYVPGAAAASLFRRSATASRDHSYAGTAPRSRRVSSSSSMHVYPSCSPPPPPSPPLPRFLSALHHPRFWRLMRASAMALSPCCRLDGRQRRRARVPRRGRRTCNHAPHRKRELPSRRMAVESRTGYHIWCALSTPAAVTHSA